MKAATLRPANDTELLDLVGKTIDTIHTSLKGAKIYFFWMLEKPLKTWGRIEVASEKLWWASGGLESEGCDIVLQLNEALWEKVTLAGRKFLVDHYLDQVKRKTGGQTDMETEEGIRALYEKKEETLKLNPRVCARHPKGFREIEEARKLWIALAKPSQYEIEFPDAPADDEDEEGEEDGGEIKPRRGRAAREVPPPVYYHEKHMLSKHGPTAVRYTGADRQPETAVGIHFFTDAAAAQAAGDLAQLDYDMDPRAVKPVREELMADREAWLAASTADAPGVLEGVATH